MLVVIGVDEVGRGCWAGPLVAGAVCLREPIDGLMDSKKLSPRKRKMLSELITNEAHSYALGWVSPEEVDELGLTEAVRLAMQRAIEQLDVSEVQIIIDGNINYLSHLQNTESIIKADDSIPAVSAASILAKVARDEYMHQISSKYPEYAFERHVGYGTKAHIDALKRFGITPIHRRSYKPIQNLAV